MSRNIEDAANRVLRDGDEMLVEIARHDPSMFRDIAAAYLSLTLIPQAPGEEGLLPELPYADAKTAYDIFRGTNRGRTVPHWHELGDWSKSAFAFVFQHANRLSSADLVAAAKVLKPFAELAESYSDDLSDKLQLSVTETCDGDSTYAFTLGDLRHAAEYAASLPSNKEDANGND